MSHDLIFEKGRLHGSFPLDRIDALVQHGPGPESVRIGRRTLRPHSARIEDLLTIGAARKAPTAENVAVYA